MCKDCQSRFDRNPLRLLDCKNPHDQELAAGAPSLEECLCEECKTHFEGLKELLTGRHNGQRRRQRLSLPGEPIGSSRRA